MTRERRCRQVIYEMGNNHLADLAGFLAVTLAAAGLGGALWMGRLHRLAMVQYRNLERELRRAEESRRRLKSFSMDLAAVLGLSLAWHAAHSPEDHRDKIERLAAALEQDVLGLERSGSGRTAGGRG